MVTISCGSHVGMSWWYIVLLDISHRKLGGGFLFSFGRMGRSLDFPNSIWRLISGISMFQSKSNSLFSSPGNGRNPMPARREISTDAVLYTIQAWQSGLQGRFRRLGTKLMRVDIRMYTVVRRLPGSQTQCSPPCPSCRNAANVNLQYILSFVENNCRSSSWTQFLKYLVTRFNAVSLLRITALFLMLSFLREAES